MSLRVRNRFRELLGELVDLEHQDPAANHARILALQDDIRHLPGYPQRYDPENDTIVPVTTTAQR